MRLNRWITIVESGPRVQSADGSTRRGERSRRMVKANRRAQPGFERIAVDTLVAEYPVQYTVRYSGLENIDNSWWVEEDGKEYRIESIYEPPIGRRRFLVLVCVERK